MKEGKVTGIITNTGILNKVTAQAEPSTANSELAYSLTFKTHLPFKTQPPFLFLFLKPFLFLSFHLIFMEAIIILSQASLPS